MSALSNILREAQPRVLYLIKHELGVLWTASKTIHLIPILSLCLRKNCQYRRCISRSAKQKFCENLRVLSHINTPSRLWFPLCFAHELLMSFWKKFRTLIKLIIIIIINIMYKIHIFTKDFELRYGYKYKVLLKYITLTAGHFVVAV